MSFTSIPRILATRLLALSLGADSSDDGE